MISDELNRQKKLRESAQRDILDIEALSKSDAFNRYFVGQLNRLMRENEKTARAGTTLEEREKARHRANFIEELMNMPASHKQSAEKLLATPAPTKPTPVQVG